MAGRAVGALLGRRGPHRPAAPRHLVDQLDLPRYGERPFETRDGDKASNFWPLAILSFGESWHNLHHADPTCARHGVDKGQIDINARLIWIFEKLGWATDVRWPKRDRLDAKRVAAAGDPAGTMSG